MRSLRVLLVVCAAMVSQSALAQEPLAAIRAACAEDAQNFCAGVQPGGGRIVACLKEHTDSLSDRCKQAAAALVGNPGGGSAPSAPSAPPASGNNVSGAAASAPAAGPSVPAATTPAKPAAAPKASTAKGAPDKAAEKFAERVITDTEHGGMRAATIHLPEKWHFESKIEWHYDRIEVPLIFSSHAENPDNSRSI